MAYLVLLFFITWVLVVPGTDVYIRFIASSVVRKGKMSKKMIHLSFDDGPDPVNTARLLPILRQMGVPATFFLVGEKAKLYPEMVREIIHEGHEIGIHTYFHRHAYLMSIPKSMETVKKGKEILEKICQKQLTWFRPPWGALNFFEYLMVKRLDLKVVLWTANAKDWKKKTGSNGIWKRLTRRVKPGSIIVLHDSGGETGAPQNMLEVLPKLIEHFKTQGFQFVTLREITGGTHGWE